MENKYYEFQNRTGRAALITKGSTGKDSHKGLEPFTMNQPDSLRSLAAMVVCGTILAGVPSRAEEGMWTFDNPPLKQLQDKYHFTPTQEWLDHVRLSSRAPERRRLGIVRQPARAAADQPPRGARPTAEELHRRARLHPRRLLRRHARARR